MSTNSSTATSTEREGRESETTVSTSRRAELEKEYHEAILMPDSRMDNDRLLWEIVRSHKFGYVTKKQVLNFLEGRNKHVEFPNS